MMPPSVHEQADAMRGWAARLRASGETKLVRVWEPTEKPVSQLILVDGTAAPVKLENFSLNLTNDLLDLTLLVVLNSKSPLDSKALRDVQAVQLSRDDGEASRVERIAFNNPNSRVKRLRLRFGSEDVIFEHFEFEFRPDRIIFRKQN